MIPIRDTVPRAHSPLTVWAIIAINAIVFVMILMLNDEQQEWVFYMFGIVPARYSHPRWAQWAGLPAHEYWPFFTTMFLHGGWLHILGNMWTLWIFGDNVEDRMGHGRFLLFYLLCGLIAGLLHYVTNLNSTVPTVGASGAIAGVMGAYFLLYPRAQVVVLFPILFYPLFFQAPAILYLGFWFFSQFLTGVLSLAESNQVGGIAWWAHVGGFVAGAILHKAFINPQAPAPSGKIDLQGVALR